MYKHWLQVKSYFRRTKSISISLIIMFIISALLLSSGLLIILKYGNFYNELKEELNPSDAYFMISDSLYNNNMSEYLNTNKHIEKIQTNEMLLLSAEIYSKEVEKEKTFNILFQNMEEQREISKWKYVGESATEESISNKMSVYIPDVMKSISGYQLNDTIKLSYKDFSTGEEKELDFIVKGYVEDVYFSSTDSGFLGFYLSQETFATLQDILKQPEYIVHTLFANVDNLENVSTIESGLTNIAEINAGSFVAMDNSKMLFSMNLELIDMSRTMMATVLSVIMVMFSIVIVIVCLLVVRFRIINTVEEDLQRIGSLKAVGYTSKQIRLSIIYQFLVISGIGSILGIALSYLALPSISLIFEQQSGLLWTQGFDLMISSITVAVLLTFVLLISLLATKRINKLTPINAINGRINRKNLKKNRKEIEKLRGPLSVILAEKTILQNIKQTIMITIIMIAVMIAGAYGVILYYNTSIDTTAFAEVPGMEITSVIAILNTEKDHTSIIDKIRKMDGVNKVQYFDEIKIKINDKEIASYVMDDYSNKQTNFIYKGEYPKENNEIALSGIVAEKLNKKIEDTITISYAEKEETFKIVGLSNGRMNLGGQDVSLRTEDIERLNSEFKQQALYIFLNENVNTIEFIEELNKNFSKEEISSITNFDKIMEEGMASYQDIIGIMGMVMLLVTILVVSLILYFMISSTITKKKKELGIQKAVGYTTLQLMNQFSLEFLIPVLTGGVIGTIIGVISFNPIMSMAMSSGGIMKTNFIVEPIWIISFAIGIVLFSYLLSLIITFRIRKISAYELVTQ